MWIYTGRMPERSVWWFRGLLRELRDEEPAGWGDGRLRAWLERHPTLVTELHQVGRAENPTWPRATGWWNGRRPESAGGTRTRRPT